MLNVFRTGGTRKVVADSDWLLKFPASEGQDLWTVSDSFEGTQIFGATGSGKTSGSGKEIALSMLDAGFGGLVLTVKADERELWEKYAKHTGRQNDLIIFGPKVSTERPYTFNFLEYEKEAGLKDDVSLTDNLVALFSAVTEIAQRGKNNQDAYWLLSMKQLLKSAIDLLLAAKKPLTFKNIHAVITSAPQTPEIAFSDVWHEGSLCWECILQVEEISQYDPRFEDALLTHAYWMHAFPGLAPETRSIVVSVFTSMADCFLRGALRELFSPTKAGGKQLDPELSQEGAIIILDLPVKKFYEVGQFAQVLYKFIWQRAVERKAAERQATGALPVFLWADEAQFFVNSNDMLFQTTARSARASTVYLSQNISNYYAIMSGDTGKAQTDSLLGNLRTKIFHANEDSVTNQWASDLIGKTLEWRMNRSSSVSSQEGVQGRGGSQFSSSQQETLDHQVQPIRFTGLIQGGPDNGLTVEAILTKGGKKWSNGKNFRVASFKQRTLDVKPALPSSFSTTDPDEGYKPL